MTVFCIVVDKGSLDDRMRDVLFLGAVRLSRDRVERRSLRSRDCDGYVRTAHQHAMLGSIGGTKFAAMLETNHGIVEVTYIVREKDITAGIASEEFFERARSEGGSPWQERDLVFTDDEFERYQAVPPTSASSADA